MQAFAIFDPTTNQFINASGRSLSWQNVPKLYETAESAKRAYRSVKGTQAYFKPNMDDAIVIEIQFVMGNKNLL